MEVITYFPNALHRIDLVLVQVGYQREGDFHLLVQLFLWEPGDVLPGGVFWLRGGCTVVQECEKLSLIFFEIGQTAHGAPYHKVSGVGYA